MQQLLECLFIKSMNKYKTKCKIINQQKLDDNFYCKFVWAPFREKFNPFSDGILLGLSRPRVQFWKSQKVSAIKFVP